jgi:hypothetical protein
MGAGYQTEGQPWSAAGGVLWDGTKMQWLLTILSVELNQPRHPDASRKIRKHPAAPVSIAVNKEIRPAIHRDLLGPRGPRP